MLDLQTHKLKVVKGQAVVDKIVPYVRMSHGDTYIYLQAGKIYTGSNEPPLDLADVPGWVWERMKTMNPVVLKQVGWFDQMNDALEEVGEEPIEPKVKQKDLGRWTCKTCGEEMEKRHQLAHTMRHRRDEKAAEQEKAAEED